MSARWMGEYYAVVLDCTAYVTEISRDFSQSDERRILGPVSEKYA
jgi:hypothetical protein